MAKHKRRDDWLCGYAAALATLARAHDEYVMIADCLGGIPYQSFVDGGAESVDLEVLLPIYQRYAPRLLPPDHGDDAVPHV